MCGISCLIYKNCNTECALQNVFEKSRDCIKRRGPDSIETHTFEINGYTIKFTASVLWLQGTKITTQPLETERSIFIYNGDIFNVKHDKLGTIDGCDRLKSGDTRLFLNILESGDDVVECLESIHGPYSFIYLDKKNLRVYFSRDFYGRRSLLFGKNEDSILISSVVVKNELDFIELPPVGIFHLDLITGKMNLNPWKIINANFDAKVRTVEKCLGDELLINNNKKTPVNMIHNFKEPEANELNIFKDLQNLNPLESLQFLLNNADWKERVDKLKTLLKEAVRTRIQTQPGICSNCIKTKPIPNSCCKDSKLGILFSGGLDCSILAVLADAFVDPNDSIDLMNVAFAGPHGYKTPDRISGLESLEELRVLRPDRVWNFLKIDVTQEELNEMRDSRIKDLIYPLNTILDDSLGCALWFASRGSVDGYISPCRVLLVGMGADELFGGYTRHRAALNKSGWAALSDSMRDDWMNISHRNLARDDRVVSDHGRQLRTPYLDEDVVEYLLSLNVWEKTFPSRELIAGLGEKILLRTLAYDLGLRGAACLKKRALQFGSRIADKKEKAHEISPRL